MPNDSPIDIGFTDSTTVTAPAPLINPWWYIGIGLLVGWLIARKVRIR